MDYPTPISRVRYFRKHGRDAYVAWLCEALSLDFENIPYDTRYEIDDFISGVIAPPSWVEAAQEVVEAEPEPIEEEEEEAIEVASENNPFSDSEIDYDSWTVVELREECRNRGIPVYGTKAEIVLRIRRDDDGLTETQPTEDETEAPSEEAAEVESDAPSDEAATEEVNEDDADSEQGNNTEEEE